MMHSVHAVSGSGSFLRVVPVKIGNFAGFWEDLALVPGFPFWLRAQEESYPVDGSNNSKIRALALYSSSLEGCPPDNRTTNCLPCSRTRPAKRMNE
jgi:hypothetical protein